MKKNQEKKTIHDNDTKLIRAINSGRRELFYELVKRHEHSLYNFGLRMCGEPRDAEDMVQDTFLNVYRYLDGFRYETRFKNWLYRIATRACIKKRRKSTYAPEKELSLEEFLPSDESQIPDEVPEWALMPIDKLLNRELNGMIRDAILALPEKYRVVIVLRDLEGFDTAETAQISGITPVNVKVRLHRARLFLRDKLKAYFNHDD